jgi:hypothetical protein
MPPVPTQQTPSPASHAPADLPFESAATAVLGRLQSSLVALLRGAPGPSGTCTEVEDTLGLDPKLAWQVFRIATSGNPLAAGMNVPVPAAMRRLLKAAAKRGVAAPIVAQVSDAFNEYERFVQLHADDREQVDVMIRAFLPQERDKRELANRQAMFKVMSQFKGASMEAEVGTYILCPSPNGRSVDRVLVVADLGLRRIRPGARIGFATMSTGPHQGATRTLDGQPSEGHWSVLLPEFCTNPMPRFEVSKTQDTTSYWVAGDDVGLRTSVDLVSAEHRPEAMKRYFEPGGSRMTGVFAAPTTPNKRTTVDLFIHHDLYPQCVPSLSVYDVVPRGVLRPIHDPTRDHDRIQTSESIRMLGRGLGNADLPYFPRYLELMEHVYRKIGRDPSDFRGFRLDVHYPICGAQYIIGFELPDAPPA